MNISFSILYNLYFTAISVVISVILARQLGPDAFGEYTWFISLTYLIAGISLAGANSLIVRETSRSEGREASIRILCKAAIIALTVFAFIIYLSYKKIVSEVGQDKLFFLIGVSILHIALVLLGASMRGMGFVKVAQLPEMVLRPTLFIAIILISAWQGRNFSVRVAVESQSIGYLIAMVIAVALFIRLVLRRVSIPSEPVDEGWFGGFIRLALVSWTTVISAQFLILMTGALSGNIEVGLFRVAGQVSLVIGLGLKAIEAVHAPVYARSFKDGNLEMIHHKLQESCKISFLAACVVATPLLIFGGEILNGLFGADYIQAVPVLHIFIIGQVLNALTGNVGVVLIAAKEDNSVVISNILGLAVMVTLAFVLIPSYGAVGAAITAAAALIVRNILCFYFCLRKVGIIALPFAGYTAR